MVILPFRLYTAANIMVPILDSVVGLRTINDVMLDGTKGFWNSVKNQTVLMLRSSINSTPVEKVVQTFNDPAQLKQQLMFVTIFSIITPIQLCFGAALASIPAGIGTLISPLSTASLVFAQTGGNIGSGIVAGLFAGIKLAGKGVQSAWALGKAAVGGVKKAMESISAGVESSGLGGLWEEGFKEPFLGTLLLGWMPEQWQEVFVEWLDMASEGKAMSNVSSDTLSNTVTSMSASQAGTFVDAVLGGAGTAQTEAFNNMRAGNASLGQKMALANFLANVTVSEHADTLQSTGMFAMVNSIKTNKIGGLGLLNGLQAPGSDLSTSFLEAAGLSTEQISQLSADGTLSEALAYNVLVGNVSSTDIRPSQFNALVVSVAFARGEVPTDTLRSMGFSDSQIQVFEKMATQMPNALTAAADVLFNKVGITISDSSAIQFAFESAVSGVFSSLANDHSQGQLDVAAELFGNTFVNECVQPLLDAGFTPEATTALFTSAASHIADSIGDKKIVQVDSLGFTVVHIGNLSNALNSALIENMPTLAGQNAVTFRTLLKQFGMSNRKVNKLHKAFNAMTNNGINTSNAIMTDTFKSFAAANTTGNLSSRYITRMAALQIMGQNHTNLAGITETLISQLGMSRGIATKMLQIAESGNSMDSPLGLSSGTILQGVASNVLATGNLSFAGMQQAISQTVVQNMNSDISNKAVAFLSNQTVMGKSTLSRTVAQNIAVVANSGNPTALAHIAENMVNNGIDMNNLIVDSVIAFTADPVALFTQMDLGRNTPTAEQVQQRQDNAKMTDMIIAQTSLIGSGFSLQSIKTFVTNMASMAQKQGQTEFAQRLNASLALVNTGGTVDIAAFAQETQTIMVEMNETMAHFNGNAFGVKMVQGLSGIVSTWASDVNRAYTEIDNISVDTSSTTIPNVGVGGVCIRCS